MEVNRHTVQHTDRVSVVIQLQLVPGWGLYNWKAAMVQIAREGLPLPSLYMLSDSVSHATVLTHQVVW